MEYVDDALAYMRVPGFEEHAFRRCRLKFEIFNELYQFEVPIINVDHERVVIRIPAYIQSAQRRKFSRIQVDDLFMKFIVLYQPLLGGQTSNYNVDTRFPYIVRELQQEEPDLYLLLRIVNEELQRISPNFAITIYQPDQEKSFMEESLSRYKQTIFINDTSTAEKYYEQMQVSTLINYQKEYYRMVRESSDEEAESFFEQKRQEDSRNCLSTYICTPLQIFDQVIGYFYVYSTVLDPIVISTDAALRLDVLGKLFSYALSKNVISRTYYRHALTRVVNISLSGLLFELNDDILFDYLTFHDKVKLTVQVKQNILHFTGEITRYYPWAEGYNVGVKFSHANPGDYKHLENFLFSRTRTTFR